MQSHGKFNSCIHFAEAKKNFETIILHHINEEQYKEAINNLRFIKEEFVNEILYRYCHVFMKHEPGINNKIITTQFLILLLYMENSLDCRTTPKAYKNEIRPDQTDSCSNGHSI